MLLRLVRQYVFPNFPVLLGSVTLLILSTILNLAPPWIIKLLIDEVLVLRDLNYLNLIAFAAVFVFAARALTNFGQRFLTNMMGQRIVRTMRTDVFRHLQTLSHSYFENQQTGKIISRVISDIDSIEHVLTGGIEELFASVLTLIGISAILFYVNPELTVFALIPIPFLILNTLGFGTNMRRIYLRVREQMGELTARLTDAISGIAVVKAFVREDYELKRFKEQVASYYHLNLRAIASWTAFLPLIGFTTGMGSVLILWFGGRLVMAGTLTVGELVAFNGYLTQFYQPVLVIARILFMLQRSLAAVERVYEVLDTKPDVTDRPNAVQLSTVSGKVEMRAVSFGYDPSSPVLKDISFQVQPGQTVALVGPSGAGKSTLVQLIMRFYDVTEGAILVDGRDIRDITLRSLRENIGMVLQDTFLFKGTARENIAYGRLDASEEEIVAAAKAAGIHDFLVSLPDGYDTELGERGVKLSGGQRQRISIARTLLKDPAILILDEATSAVDTEVEVQIQKALEQLMVGRTTFVIAHRLSTITNADQILVLKDGRLVEQGSHDELMQHNGVYAELYRLQFHLAEEGRKRVSGSRKPSAVSDTAEENSPLPDEDDTLLWLP